MIGAVLFAFGAACLPPEMPALDTLVASRPSIRMVENEAGQAQYLVARVYSDGAGHAWRVFMLGDSVALVDDHMTDGQATDWWLDGGLLTDDIPPVARTKPQATCQFHRRGLVASALKTLT